MSSNIKLTATQQQIVNDLKNGYIRYDSMCSTYGLYINNHFDRNVHSATMQKLVSSNIVAKKGVLSKEYNLTINGHSFVK